MGKKSASDPVRVNRVVDSENDSEQGNSNSSVVPRIGELNFKFSKNDSVHVLK
jgi:hypothetical protein